MCYNNSTLIILYYFVMKDYFKLKEALKLDEYKLSFYRYGDLGTFSPFSTWENDEQLYWYQAYNHAKHNRYQNFGEATLENLFNGICSLVVVLAAQFPNVIGFLGGDGLSFTSDDPRELIISSFTIKYPQFAETDQYDFDWNVIKSVQEPFDKYNF